MNFLTHNDLSVAHRQKHMTGWFYYSVSAALGTSREAFQHGTFFHKDRRNLQRIDVRAVIVLSVCNGRLQHLLDDRCAFLRAEGEDVKRFIDLQPTHLVGHQATLLGRKANAVEFSLHLHIRLPASSPLLFYRRRGPWKCAL